MSLARLSLTYGCLGMGAFLPLTELIKYRDWLRADADDIDVVPISELNHVFSRRQQQGLDHCIGRSGDIRLFMHKLIDSGQIVFEISQGFSLAEAVGDLFNPPDKPIIILPILQS